MPVTINGTTGVSGVDGSASTPAMQGTDTNTGMFFPAADTIAFTTNGTEDMRIDSVGNVGVGTTSPTDSGSYGRALDVNGTTGAAIYARTNGSATNYALIGSYGSDGYVANRGAGNLIFQNNNAERARIDTSGNLLVGTTTTVSGAKLNVSNGTQQFQFGASLGSGSVFAAYFNYAGSNGVASQVSGTGGIAHYQFYNPNGAVGSIVTNGSGTAYNTSSDYRLKYDIAPMTGALAKVAALKPITYKWNVDDSDGEGFIAHELAEVVPQAVTGEKDAVDADGNPVYQGIDTSFLVATLTAAIQELNAKVESLTAEIATLKGAQA